MILLFRHQAKPCSRPEYVILIVVIWKVNGVLDNVSGRHAVVGVVIRIWIHVCFIIVLLENVLYLVHLHSIQQLLIGQRGLTSNPRCTIYGLPSLFIVCSFYVFVISHLLA